MEKSLEETRMQLKRQQDKFNNDMRVLASHTLSNPKYLLKKFLEINNLKILKMDGIEIKNEEKQDIEKILRESVVNIAKEKNQNEWKNKELKIKNRKSLGFLLN